MSDTHPVAIKQGGYELDRYGFVHTPWEFHDICPICVSGDEITGDRDWSHIDPAGGLHKRCFEVLDELLPDFELPRF